MPETFDGRLRTKDYAVSDGAGSCSIAKVECGESDARGGYGEHATHNGVALVLATCLVSAAIAETRKEFRFTVGPKANISVDTRYGAITVKPGYANHVVVLSVLQSDKVNVDHLQKGNRIEIESQLLPGRMTRVDESTMS